MRDIAQILVVDDEPDIVELVSYNLRKEGFTVSTASDAEETLEKIGTEDFSLVLLDLMLPGMQGMELCRILKKDAKTENLPIIMLTAKVEEVDRVLGLESGADDYVTKPFSPRELIARVKAVLRRRAPLACDDAVEIAGLRLDPAAHRITGNGLRIELGATEFRLLHFFMTHPNRVF